ncbi:3,4-dihydroxyphenylacetate 2,3-dioxygenase [Insolitispirillum peregrinum]|uniref:3,4-dihydroxyphenylacetate 2,3-dioxygenase n=1 Tax=Insolitispirillum peregrinum TaxID=80876 RepID=UPI00362162E8
MGKLAFAAKIAHVPTMYLSEQEGPFKGCRQQACDGHRAISQRMRDLGVDTVIVLDSHWLINNAYHINANSHFKGVFTSNEFPHLLSDMSYEYQGNPEVGDLIAKIATEEKGVTVRAHHIPSLELEYGTLVPMWLMNGDQAFKVVSVACLCTVHDHQESAKIGEAIREAIERSEGTFAILASGSLSHAIHPNTTLKTMEHFFTISNEFYKQVDLRVLDLWKEGRFAEFTRMLPLYAKACHGEGLMHDTAMLLGALGGENYAEKVEIVTEYFEAAGTGQVNAVFPIAA